MSKVKTVFGNDELAHQWAAACGDEVTGRNSGNSFYFKGSEIYSYGPHFLAAKKYSLGTGKAYRQFALVNSDSYSSSTAKHLCAIRSSLQGRMEYFSVSNPNDLKQAIIDLDSDALKTVEAALKAVKVASLESIEYTLSNINDSFKDANTLRALVNPKLKPKLLPAETKREVIKHLRARLKRYHELNTPEAIAEKAAAKARREEALELKKVQSFNENLTKFIKGEEFQSFAMGHDLIRVKGDRIETSRKAYVPLREAQNLFTAIIKAPDAKNLVGETIGDFSIDSIETVENDTLIKVGCHRFSLNEVSKILG